MISVNGQEYTLNQCTVVRYEEEFGHSYAIDGEPVAGVTTLLSMGTPPDAGLLEYFKRTDKDDQEIILADANERGTNVHQAIEDLLLGLPVRSDGFKRPREKKGIAAFVDFFEKTTPTEVVTEQVVAYKNKDIKFAGTLDFLGTINGKRLLIDFKTSAVPSIKHSLQVQAYKAAIEQSTNEKIDDCYVLYLGTSNKGARVSRDDNDLPTSGFGWRLIKSDHSFLDFGLAYRMALLMNNGKYPTPPQVEAYPEEWKLLNKETKNVREKVHQAV